MISNSLFVDIFCYQHKKHGQNAYGDAYLSQRYPDEDRMIAVLSDGLGSGVKANILSQMTATMLLKFVAAGREILDASEVIMNSLPICQVRKISYATFSIVDCNSDGEVKIVEEGNPEFLWIREGKVLEAIPKVITSKTFTSRHLHLYNLKLQPQDRLIFCSDGVTQTGMGSKRLPLGWRREGLVEFLLPLLKSQPQIDSRALAQRIVEKAETKEKEGRPKDDTSAMVLYFREPRHLLVFTGPPYYAERDKEYCDVFASFNGKKAICGGTTANMIARELKRSVISSMKNEGNLPPHSQMSGVNLVTEGILTLTQTAEYLENGLTNTTDAATRLLELLLDSDCIEFMVGAKFNQAHYDPDLPVELEIRKNIVKRIAKLLESKYTKKVAIKFI